MEECGRLHGHICPGQLLGVRMALLGCRLIDIKDPRGADRKKIIVWVEIDRCMADAVCAVVGVSLGRRSLKFYDYGKVAASFLNLTTGKAVRIAALDSSRNLADVLHQEIDSKKERQMRAYSEVRDGDLFKIEFVEINLGELDMPGHPKKRVVCSSCGEGINDGREQVQEDGELQCKSCGLNSYYKSSGLIKKTI